MKILIIGASGSGTTTLAKSLKERLDFKHLDVDDYYWEKTDPPFQKKIPKEIRRRNLLEDFNKNEEVILSGSLVSWGDEWLDVFNMAVFITLDPAIRMERLENRELERYGNRLTTDPVIKKNSEEFLEWAGKYDDPLFIGRSISVQKKWLGQLNCPVLNIDGSRPLDVKVDIVISKFKSLR